MKVAFISDIHGNAVALESVLEGIQAKNVDKIIVLGDICYRGPEPKRALDLIRSLDTVVIKGNADEWVVRGIQEGEVPKQALEMMRTEREWTVERLQEEDVQYLSQLPTEHRFFLTEKLEVTCFHGTPHSLFEIVPPTASEEEIVEKMLVQASSQLVLYGHIHHPYIRSVNGTCMANLGSVGLPFDGQPLSSYIIVEGNDEQYNVSIHRVPFDVGAALQKAKELNYPNVEFLEKVYRTGKVG